METFSAGAQVLMYIKKQRILLYFAIRPPHSLIVIICGLYMYMYQKLCFAQLVYTICDLHCSTYILDICKLHV